jgi:ABC-type phosphate transport system auxiliary subunit
MFTNAFWVPASVSDTKCLVGEVVNTNNIPNQDLEKIGNNSPNYVNKLEISEII